MGLLGFYALMAVFIGFGEAFGYDVGAGAAGASYLLMPYGIHMLRREITDELRAIRRAIEGKDDAG